MKPVKIKDILSIYLAKTNYKKIDETVKISSVWKKVVGEVIAKNTIVHSLENGKVTVQVSSPVWRNELIFQKNDIIQKLNSKLEKNKIKDIRFL